MIRSGVALQHCERVVVVHGVREVAQLGYRNELMDYARAHSQRFTYIPVISREPPPPGALAGRIPALIQDGQLEGRAGLRFDPGYSRVLLCGNPQMIVDVKQVLQGRGLELHRRRKPGHILSENYW
jgi:ferredoxin--NADP+ reductase